MRRWAMWVGGVVLAASVVAGCTVPTAVPGTTTTTPGEVGTNPQPGATWVAGDSLSTYNSWPGRLELASVAVAGRGFVVTYNGPTIGENTLAAVARYGLPGRIVVMGGVNDVKQLDPPTFEEVTGAMAALEDALVAQGIEVVWATEPGWQFVTQIAPLNDWIRATRDHVVDCSSSVSDWSYTVDGTHPTEAGQQVLADCIGAALGGVPTPAN